VDDIKQMAALTALNDMMAKGYVNICTIDSVAKMLGVLAKGADYDVLHTLHCVNFDRMPKDLLDRVPALVQACLSGDRVFQFSTHKMVAGQPVFLPKEAK